MIKRVEFCKDYRCFDAGEAIDFRPGLNLIVGDQGTGKTTLFELLRRQTTPDERPDRTIKVSVTCTIGVRCFDAEKDNPRTKEHLMENAMFAQLSSLYRSHGEVILDIIQCMPRPDDHQVVYLLDEPDMGLSPRSIFRLIKLFEDVTEEGHQILAIVHNPILIESVEEVYDMETRAWVSPSNYMQRQRVM